MLIKSKKMKSKIRNSRSEKNYRRRLYASEKEYVDGMTGKVTIKNENKLFLIDRYIFRSNFNYNKLKHYLFRSIIFNTIMNLA